VRILPKDLRGYIPKSAEWVRGPLGGAQEFRQAKVNNLGLSVVAFISHHYILELKISVKNSKAVQMLDPLADGPGELLRLLFVQVEFPSLQVLVEISPW